MEVLVIRWFRYPRKLALILIVLVAIIPRIFHLNSSLWYDETFASGVKLGFSLESLAWIAYDVHPPLYNLLMLLWTGVFGDSEISLRLIPLLCSLASIVVAWQIAAFLIGQGRALFVAAMMALSGASVFYAQEARSYSFAVLTFLLMIYFLLRYERLGKSRDLPLFLLFSIVSAAAHAFSLVFVLCLMAVLFWQTAVANNIVEMFRFMLLQLALIFPFYFFVILMLFFTSELNQTLPPLRAIYPQDAVAFSLFSVFGLAGLEISSAIDLAVAAVVVAGFVSLLRKRDHCGLEKESCNPAVRSFQFPGLSNLLFGVVSMGVTASLAIIWASLLLPSDFLPSVIRNDKHHALLQEMLGLLGRTGIVFLMGYLLAGVGWFLLARGKTSSRIANLWQKVRNGKNRPMGSMISAIFTFPIVAILVVMLISHVRPIYQSPPRYMLTLLPFVLIAVAAAIFWIPWKTMRTVAISFVLAGQLVALAEQERSLDLLKPDYKTALAYRMNSRCADVPLASTVLWELRNVGAYYSYQLGYERLELVRLPEATNLSRVCILIPERDRQSEEKSAKLREILENRFSTQVRFRGLTLYEVDGPAE